MVKLNFGKELPLEEQGYTITVSASDAHDYLQTIQALIHLVQAADRDLASQDDLYLALNLLLHMLPSTGQLK